MAWYISPFSKLVTTDKQGNKFDLVPWNSCTNSWPMGCFPGENIHPVSCCRFEPLFRSSGNSCLCVKFSFSSILEIQMLLHNFCVFPMPEFSLLSTNVGRLLCPRGCPSCRRAAEDPTEVFLLQNSFCSIVSVLPFKFSYFYYSCLQFLAAPWSLSIDVRIEVPR